MLPKTPPNEYSAVARRVLGWALNPGTVSRVVDAFFSAFLAMSASHSNMTSGDGGAMELAAGTRGEAKALMRSSARRTASAERRLMGTSFMRSGQQKASPANHSRTLVPAGGGGGDSFIFSRIARSSIVLVRTGLDLSLAMVLGYHETGRGFTGEPAKSQNNSSLN